MKSIDRNIRHVYYNTTHKLYIHPAETDRLLNFFFHGMETLLVPAPKNDFVRTVLYLNISLFSKQYPCGTDKLQCERPYSFLHRLALTSNLSDFIVSKQSCVL